MAGTCGGSSTGGPLVSLGAVTTMAKPNPAVAIASHTDGNLTASRPPAIACPAASATKGHTETTERTLMSGVHARIQTSALMMIPITLVISPMIEASATSGSSFSVSGTESAIILW